MGLRGLQQAEVVDEGRGAKKYRNDEWAIRIDPRAGDAWFLRKSGINTNGTTFLPEHASPAKRAKIKERALGTLTKLGIDPSEIVARDVRAIVETIASGETKEERLVGYVAHFSRSVDGVDVFDAKATLQYDDAMNLRAWSARWFGNRASVSSVPVSPAKALSRFESNPQISQVQSVTRQWLALPTADGETVLVPGYVTSTDTSRLAVPAIALEGEIMSILDVPEQPAQK
jgi:hypothetical protein